MHRKSDRAREVLFSESGLPLPASLESLADFVAQQQWSAPKPQRTDHPTARPDDYRLGNGPPTILIRGYHDEVLPAVYARNRLVTHHSECAARADVSSLFGFTVLTLHVIYIACFGSGHLRGYLGAARMWPSGSTRAGPKSQGRPRCYTSRLSSGGAKQAGESVHRSVVDH
jgi:hypothetical protein